jgi:hypothetical protein
MPWMAFTQSAKSQITALDYTVGRDGFLGVGRAAGVKTTVVTEERTQAGFVAVDNKNEQATH